MEETNLQEPVAQQSVQPIPQTPAQPISPLGEQILQPTIPPVPQSSTKLPKKMIVIAGSILLLLLIGTAGFLIASKNTSTAPKTYTPKPTMTPTLLKEMTPSIPAVLPTISHSATQSATQTNLMDCGKTVMNSDTKASPESILAQQCFTQAAKVCKPAKIYANTTTGGIVFQGTATLEILGKKEDMCELKTTILSLTPVMTTDITINAQDQKFLDYMKQLEGKYITCPYTTEELVYYLDASFKGEGNFSAKNNCTGTMLEIPFDLQ